MDCYFRFLISDQTGRENMSKKTFGSILLAAALSLCFGSFAFGQEVTGSIVGSVKDVNGGAVAGATVILIDPSKADLVVRTVTTDDDGTFSIPNIPISTYSVSVESASFKKYITTGVKVDVGQRRSVDAILEAGNIAEVVTVEADALSIETSTPTVGTVISGDQVRELSINNRNFVQLVTLAPGVSSNLADQVYVGTTNPEGQANTTGISINGARQSQNTYTIDGADITDRGSNITIQAYPSVDSIGEFKVLRALYPAESGRSGGGQINVVTRSGTDEFHGSFFEFVRNEKFNANSFFNNRNPSIRDENGKARRTPFRYNNYGFTVGGPIYFLRFGEHDPGESVFAKVKKTYFFFSEEQRKDRRSTTLSSQVPDANLRAGVFSQPICLSGTIQTVSGVTTRTCSQILNPGTPLSTLAPINPVAQQYLSNIFNQIPLPTQAPYGLSFAGAARADFRQEILKLDTSFTDNWTAYYRYQRDSIPTVDVNSLFNSGSGIPGISTSETDSPGRTHTFQTNYVISPKLILEGRYVYSYGAIVSRTTGAVARENTPISIPMPYAADDDRIPQITVGGFNSITAFGPYNNFSDKHDYSGNLTWISGSHTMKFGASFSKYRKNEDNGLGGVAQGAFSGFNNTTLASPTNGSVCIDVDNTTPIQCPNGTPTTQQNWANFLLGNNVTFTQTKFRLTADFRQRNFEWYAQDEFRVRRNLTLYMGLRYSFFGSPWAANGLLTNFDPTLYNPADAPDVRGNGDRVSGSGNFCNGIIVNAQNYQTGPASFQCTPTASPFGKYIVKSPKNNFAPRVGLAWDPFGSGETVIRTGYGIYHDQTLLGHIETHLGDNPPYQETVTVTRTRLDQPIPPGTPPGAIASLTPPRRIRGIDTDYQTPYVQHWSLDVQHLLTPKTMLSVGYYGSKGTHLIGIADINNLPPGYALEQTCASGTSITPTVPCQQRDATTQVPIPFTSESQELILDQLRPYKGWRGIAMVQPRYNSNYHSLQVSATHRFTGASQIQLAYTWSKNLTDNQSDRSNAPMDAYNIPAEYSRAFLDRRHITTVNYVYELPWFDKQRGFTGKVLGGWQVSGIGTYQTGLPLTPTYAGFDPAGIGFLNGLSPAGGRPFVLGDPNTNAPNTFDQWFNITAFQRSNPPTSPAIVGNAGRGVIHGPRTFRIDFTLTKNFQFTESMRLQLRAEAFNALNTTNFTSIQLAATSSTFGQVTGARDPRTMQFGVKFYF